MPNNTLVAKRKGFVGALQLKQVAPLDKINRVDELALVRLFFNAVVGPSEMIKDVIWVEPYGPSTLYHVKTHHHKRGSAEYTIEVLPFEEPAPKFRICSGHLTSQVFFYVARKQDDEKFIGEWCVEGLHQVVFQEL